MMLEIPSLNMIFSTASSHKLQNHFIIFILLIKIRIHFRHESVNCDHVSSNKQIYDNLLKIIQEFNEFMDTLPLLNALHREGMQPRHWDQVSQRIGGRDLRQGGKLSFQRLLDLELMNELDFC